MRVLFVNPIEAGSGETVTSIHMAHKLAGTGHEVRFLASEFAQRFISEPFPRAIHALSQDGEANVKVWDAALREFRPHVIVFADYPMLFVKHGVVPLGLQPEWVARLNEVDAVLATLDHFGFAQHEMRLLFGAPHLWLRWEHFPPIPRRMHVLLPCPMHEPGFIAGRTGLPFRYWDLPLGPSSRTRSAVRVRYIPEGNGAFILHAVPNWACRAVKMLNLPLYEFWPALLANALRGIDGPVTIVSVNDGALLPPAPRKELRIVNLPPLSTTDFEELLFACDLFVTENRLSISLGKAVCGLRPCTALVNSYALFEALERTNEGVREILQSMEQRRLGSVYRHDTYPGTMLAVLDQIVLYRDNSLTSAFWTTELYGGEQTAVQFAGMLTSEQKRADLLRNQETYVERLRQLPDAAEVLEEICGAELRHGCT